MKFKNRLGAPESIHMRGFSPKNEQIRPRGLGCRGGATDFGGFSPCISITSVVMNGIILRGKGLLKRSGKASEVVFWFVNISVAV